jgi:hypothetical protein
VPEALAHYVYRHAGQLPELTMRIKVSTPHAYPIKQVACALAGWRGTGMGTRPIGHGGEGPWADEERVHCHFWSHAADDREYPVVGWVDWHGNRYYQYRLYTERFSQSADFLDAALKIDEWIRRGPNPD